MSPKSLVALERDRAEEAAIVTSAATLPPHTPFHTRVLIMCLCTMSGVEFSTVLPSLWLYVQELSISGATLGLTPISVQLYAQVFFTIASMATKLVVGPLADRMCFRPLFAVCTAVPSIGGLLYGVARTAGGYRTLLAARLVMGVGGGMSTVANAFTVRAARDIGQRQQQLATNAACTLVGVLVGPGIVPIFAAVQFSIAGFKVDERNLPGFFLFLVFAGLGALQPWLLVEPPPAAAAAAPAAAPDAATTAASSQPPARPRWFLAASLGIDLALASMFGCVMFSTTPVVTIITEDRFGWGPIPNAFLFLGVALFTLCGVLATGSLLKAGTSPAPILLASASLLLVHQLIVGFAEAAVFRTPSSFILWVGSVAISYACLNGSIAGQITRTVPAGNVGFYMGITGVVDSAGQASGPLILKLFGADDGHLPLVISTSRLALAVPTTLLIALHATRLLWVRAEEERASSHAMV